MATTGASPNLAATLAANLKAARKTSGLTQHEVAVALGSGDNMKVSRWERGEHKPSIENLVSLAELYGCDPAWFYMDHTKVEAA